MGYSTGAPKRFSPGSPFMITRIKSQIAPINGIRLMNIHPPPLPISCNRRTVTANEGINSANDTAPDNTANTIYSSLTLAKMLISSPNAKLITIIANTKSQYSFRSASACKIGVLARYDLLEIVNYIVHTRKFLNGQKLLVNLYQWSIVNSLTRLFCRRSATFKRLALPSL